MAEGRSRADWGLCSSVLAMIANVNRDAKKRRKPFAPSEFNPFSGRKGKRPGRKKVTVEELTRDVLAMAEKRGGKKRPPPTNP
jgi:hypothetical protein